MTTPNEVVLQLAQLARDLDANVQALESAELEAVTRRHAADLAMSRAFVAALGSVEQRKNDAFIQCERLLLDASTAEAVVRHLKRRSDAIRVRIDVGRTVGSTLRAEMALAGVG
jgi:hypothetical protein